MFKYTSQNELFLDISYDELEILNLKAKELAKSDEKNEKIEKIYLDYLESEKRIKAVTICFSSIEWQLHMLDYDKKFFIKWYKNLTFDGSSVRGFSNLEKSDLKLCPDFSSFRWLPSDIFWTGKVLMFANVKTIDDKDFPTCSRSFLARTLKKLKKEKDFTVNVAPEIEGFLLKWLEAEQNYDEKNWFELASEWWYFNALPDSLIKKFIDKCAESQRALWFENEKDHPEVAPSQFELNFSYTEALIACDQILLYKLICRQVAFKMWYTSSFLPKPISWIAGSWMHINISISEKWKNIFYDKDWDMKFSDFALEFSKKILNHASELCIFLNPSVNAYRRLDPKFEAPNQIKISASDRSAMIRVPAWNKNSARIEIRSVSPDVNPYLVIISLLLAWLYWDENRKQDEILSSNILDAIDLLKSSDFFEKYLWKQFKEKYLEYKIAVANRSGKDLWKKVKNGEILFHHEVTNQVLWNDF